MLALAVTFLDNFHPLITIIIIIINLLMVGYKIN